MERLPPPAVWTRFVVSAEWGGPYAKHTMLANKRQSPCFGCRFAKPMKPANAEILMMASIQSMTNPQRKAPVCGAGVCSKL
jgi:hypothetical protein